MNATRFNHRFKQALFGLLTVVGLTATTVSHAADTHVSKGKILMVAANPTQASNGWPIGVWAAEISHPYDELTHAGYQVEIVSPKGGDLMVDTYSDPRHESGYSASDITSLGFLTSTTTSALLKNTKSLSDANAKDYAAIIVAGGQSPMYTFRDNAPLQKIITQFYESGKPTAALCHGVAALVNAKLFDWYVEPAMKQRGARYVQGGMWADFAVADKNLITGQQQHSGRSVARLVMAQLKK